MPDYPEGYRPGWWVCPHCGSKFHDSWQAGDMVAWDADPDCPEGARMRRTRFPRFWSLVYGWVHRWRADYEC